MLRRQQAAQSQRAFRDGLPPLTQPRPFGSRPSVHSTTKWLKRSNNRLGGVKSLYKHSRGWMLLACLALLLFASCSSQTPEWTVHGSTRVCVCVCALGFALPERLFYANICPASGHAIEIAIALYGKWWSASLPASVEPVEGACQCHNCCYYAVGAVGRGRADGCCPAFARKRYANRIIIII